MHNRNKWLASAICELVGISIVTLAILLLINPLVNPELLVSLTIKEMLRRTGACVALGLIGACFIDIGIITASLEEES